MTKKEKYTALDHKEHGVGGVIRGELRYRDQDREFVPGVMYAVVFFPKIEGIGKATWHGIHDVGTLARTPELAISKFMERITESETWETYHKAGHRVRRVRIADLGDAA